MAYKRKGFSGLGDLTSSIASAIAQMEGYNTAGTLAQRNNNPGNLRSGVGQIGTDANGFAIFPDAATGFAALDNQINLNINRGLTLQEFFGGKPGVYAGYAPSSDSNNPVQYANFVGSKAGIATDVPLSSLLAPSAPDTSGSDSTAAPTSTDFSSLFTGSDLSSAAQTLSSSATGDSLYVVAGAIGLGLLLWLVLR